MLHCAVLGGSLRDELRSRKEIVMKKMVLGLVFALEAFGLIASPAMAAPAPTAADQAFLATLVAPEHAPTLTGTRTITGKSSCTATAQCGPGLTLTCAGVGSCMAVDQNCGA